MKNFAKPGVFLIIIATIAALFCFSASAASEFVTATGTCGTNLTWTLYDDGELVIEGTGEMTNWPDYTNVPWYYHSSSIKKVTIENSVTTIGDHAFYYCENLSGIHIHDAVTYIGDFAFSRTGIEKYTVDSDNANYSNDENGVLFDKNKTKLIQYPAGNPTQIYTVPDSVKTIADYSFYQSESLVKAVIPNSVTYIGIRAFTFCSALESADIPDNVTSIGEYAFAYTNIKTVNIPDSVVSIGEQAFFTYPLEKITVDSNNAKYSCDENGILFDKNKTTLIQCPANTSVKTYSIPDGVTTIEIGAFYYCSNLTDIVIPDSVNSVGLVPFTYCFGLKNVTVYSRNIIFCSRAFYMCHHDLTLYGYAGSTTETYANEKQIPFVKLKASLPGDVTGDGDVNRMDLLRLGKYFSGWTVAIDEFGADVTGDGTVNRMDLLRLGKHFSGWTVTLGPENEG